VLIGIATMVALTGLVLGYRATLAPEIVPAKDAPEEQGFWRVLYNKYYVDELYDAIVVRPLNAVSTRLLWRRIDQQVIDGGLVNGSAGVSRMLGRIGSRLQTGQLGFYILLFLIGALWVLRAVSG
jgi:NADH-quinone oxidoreductase subunit L